MAYTITSMQRRPDIGFSSVSRHTADGARRIAADLTAQGAVEVEVRDDHGDLRDWREMDGASEAENEVLKRLAPS